MSALRQVIYLSGSRADFGLMRSTLLQAARCPDLRVQVAVTGMHLSTAHGHTVDDIRECFNLISIRERELSEAARKSWERPYYPDQPQPTKVVKISRAVKVLPDH